MADGGGENHALTVEELLEETSSPAISKVIARRNVSFSNSPIEAINKIMKRYLRVHRPADEDQLIQCIEDTVYDYTEVRPHGSLDDMIPMEVYRLQPPKQDLSKAFSTAKAQRIAYNSASGCRVCS